jgi:hypothetical protein
MLSPQRSSQPAFPIAARPGWRSCSQADYTHGGTRTRYHRPGFTPWGYTTRASAGIPEL